MADMTVQQHNEQLVREKIFLQQQLDNQVAVLGRIIIGLMGRYKTKRLTPEQWEKCIGEIELTLDDDGGIVITRLSPNGEIEDA